MKTHNENCPMFLALRGQWNCTQSPYCNCEAVLIPTQLKIVEIRDVTVRGEEMWPYLLKPQWNIKIIYN